MQLALPDLIAPHYCCSCGEIGAVLCEYCKYDIVSDPFESCIVCRAPVGQAGMLCGHCTVPYSRAWCVGARGEALKSLIDAYKFERTRAAYRVLVDLLDTTLPRLPREIVIVPIPTVAPHVRARGYAHMELVAKQFALQRNLAYAEVLYRKNNATQLGSTRRERIAHAKTAFGVKPLEHASYLLLDDVFTTGATLEYAARALRVAGAQDVWVAILSRQPLEK